jgi:hypothetical protein
MIVQPADFIGEVRIANTSQEDVAADLNHFIQKYEPIFLTELLGETLYADLSAGLGEVPIPEKWTGLKNKIKLSIVNYIYWYYITDQHIQTVGVGQAVSKAGNATIVSPVTKLVRAWNEMQQNNIAAIKFINANTEDYGDYYKPYWLTYCEHGYFWGNVYNCILPDILCTQNQFGL